MPATTVFAWLADVAHDVRASVAAVDEGPMGWPPFQDDFLMPDRIAVRRESFGTAEQRWRELMPEARSWTHGDLLLWDCSRVRGEDAYDRQTVAGELLKKRLRAP